MVAGPAQNQLPAAVVLVGDRIRVSLVTVELGDEVVVTPESVHLEAADVDVRLRDWQAGALDQEEEVGLEVVLRCGELRQVDGEGSPRRLTAGLTGAELGSERG